VVFPSLFSQDSRFPQTENGFLVQQLSPEAGVEAFAVSIIPE
jgi:hypothetical protein